MGTSSAVGARAQAWRHKSAAAPAHCCARLLPAIRGGCPPRRQCSHLAGLPGARGGAPCRAPARFLFGCRLSPCRHGRAALPCGGRAARAQPSPPAPLRAHSMPPQGFPFLKAQRVRYARSTTSKLYLTSGTAHGTISTVQDGRCNLLCCSQTPFNANKGYHIFPVRVKWYPLFFHFFLPNSSASAYNIVTASSEWFSSRCTRSKLPCA